jgi:hypothetical protein
MEYITFIEHNHKENEMFVFYLQYTGNEEALEKFTQFVKKAEYDMDGDYSDFQINLDVKFSQDAVDQHCKLDYGSYSHMFQKVNGKFECPFEGVEDDSDDENNGEDYEINPIDLGYRFDELFYGTRIVDYFR